MSARGRAGAARPPEVFCLLALAVAPPAGRAPRPGPSPAAARPASAPIAAVPPLPPPPAPPPAPVGALCLGGGRRHTVRPAPGAPQGGPRSGGVSLSRREGRELVPAARPRFGQRPGQAGPLAGQCPPSPRAVSLGTLRGGTGHVVAFGNAVGAAAGGPRCPPGAADRPCRGIFSVLLQRLLWSQAQ